MSRKNIALAVATDSTGRIVLLRSGRRSHRWELPGGAIEVGEEPMNAALRELREETGLLANHARLTGLYQGARDDVLRIVFAMDGLDPDSQLIPPNSEVVEVSWFRLDRLPRPMPVLAREMVHDALAGRHPASHSVVDDSELIHPGE